MLKLAAVMPITVRPTNSSHSVGAIAITKKSIASPKLEIRITGRRPKRSDSAPWIGEKMNWVIANTVLSTPTHQAARAVPPPISCSTRCGSTGMMMPKASMSSSTVTKMKASAARRGEAEAVSKASGEAGSKRAR